MNVYLLKQDRGYQFIIIGIYTNKNKAEETRQKKIKEYMYKNSTAFLERKHSSWEVVNSHA